MVNGQVVTIVWYQPLSSFARWKARGVTTVYGFVNDPGNVTLDQFLAGAAANGLNVILQQSAARASDYSDSRILAIANEPDEPNAGGNVKAAQMYSQYQQLKLLTSKPITINLDGRAFLYSDPTPYIAAGDWIFQDTYPINFGETAGSITTVGDRTAQLVKAANGKPVFAFIECSNQRLDLSAFGLLYPDYRARMRGPTADEFEQMVRLAINAGASGVGYFADVIGAFFVEFDGVITSTGSNWQATQTFASGDVETRMSQLVSFLGIPVPAPVISNIVVAGTTTTAVVTWTTDLNSTSQVSYYVTGMTSISTPIDNASVVFHQVQLTGLTPGTTYNFAVTSGGKGGISQSPVSTFTTLNTPTVAAITQTGRTLSSSPVTFPVIPTDVAPTTYDFLSQLKVFLDNIFRYLRLPDLKNNNANYYLTFNQSAKGFKWEQINAGTGILVNGSCFVPYTGDTSNAIILTGAKIISGTPGALYVSGFNSGRGFTITSTSFADNSTFIWEVKNSLKLSS